MSNLGWLLTFLATTVVILHVCHAAPKPQEPPQNQAEKEVPPAAGSSNTNNSPGDPSQGGSAGNPALAAAPAAENPAPPNNLPGAGNKPSPANKSNQQQEGNPGNVNQLTVIAEHRDCVEDVKRLCPQPPTGEGDNQQQRIQHNFEILECFMSYEGDEKPPSPACQTVVYNYKADLSKDERFDEAAKSVCKDFIEKSELHKVCTSQEKGAFLPCLIEHAYDLNEEEEKHTPCYKFLNKMEMVIFSDYHLVHDFIKQCQSDIDKFKCGRVFDDRDKEQQQQQNLEQHMQGATIACLEKNMQDLGKDCKREIMSVAELQADDYHLDRPLYFACKQDRKTLCGAVKNGEGKVYECLMQHQNNPKLSEDCRKEMVRREQMMQEDIKVNKGFYVACKDLLKHYNCPLEPEHDNMHVAMSSALICLRNADEDAKEADRIQPSTECVNEIESFSSVLMNDYQVDVEVVHNCQDEIERHCKGMKTAQQQDGTIHCLMALAMPARKDEKEDKKAFKSVLNDKCLASLSNLVEEADAFEHNAVDGYLMDQCQREIREHCGGEKENPVDCLLDKIEDGTLPQTNECVKHILELQYFVSRNYKMDHKLARACKDDLIGLKLHHEMKKGEQGPDPQGIVFGQLWKVVRDQIRIKNGEERGEKEKPVSPDYDVSDQCIREVLRVVHERAVSIDLMPELEQACMPILSTTCANAPPGEEMKCLQDNYDEISQSEHEECKELLGQFIEDQDADAKLDYILMKSCEPSIQKYCKPAMDAIERGEADDGAVIECLIDNKFRRDMDPKCFAGIEHHQLVNMKSYNFNTKFREACKKDYEQHCVHKTNRVDVILCLSEAVRNDTLLDQPQRISAGCRKQLTAESLKWEESVNLDPKFMQACAKTLNTYCKNVKAGPGEDHMEEHLRCVRKVGLEELERQEKSCARYVFKQVEINNMLAGAGAMVFRMCKADIKKFCEGHREPESLLECLDERYEDLSKPCQKALDEEEEEDNEDIRLNPALYMPCRQDINKFCKEIMDTADPEDSHTLHGQVIECLKMEYVKGTKSKLSETCTNQMHLLAVRVQNRDYKQDYILTHECKKEIEQCSAKNAGQKEIISCLKEKLFKGELRDDKKCQDEVFRLITENRVDIHTDRELYESCRSDIASSPCGILPAGSGRVMSCLLSLHEGGKIKDPHCRDTLSNRMELWQKAAKLSPPETLKEVWDDLTTSSSRYYFLSVVLAVVFIVLLVGMLCGRWTKRVAAEIKNR